MTIHTAHEHIQNRGIVSKTKKKENSMFAEKTTAQASDSAAALLFRLT